MVQKYEKTPALVFNLSACADISPNTKEIHLFYWNTLLGRTRHFWTLLLDVTFGCHFQTLLLDVTFGRHFWTLLLEVTFGRYFWTSLMDITFDVPFKRHFWTLLLEVTFGRYFWTSLLNITFNVPFGHHFLERLHLCLSLQGTLSQSFLKLQSCNQTIVQNI